MSPAVPTLAQIRATIRAGMWIDVTAHRAPDPMHLTQRRLVSRVTARDISLVADGGGETIPWPAASCIEMDPDGTLRFCDRDDGGVRMTLRPARTATPPDDPDLQFALVYLAEAPRHESRPDSTFTRHAAQLAAAGLAERYLHGGASPAWTLTPAGRDAAAAIDPARRAGFEESRIRNLIRDSVQGATGARSGSGHDRSHLRRAGRRPPRPGHDAGLARSRSWPCSPTRSRPGRPASTGSPARAQAPPQEPLTARQRRPSGARARQAAPCLTSENAPD